MADPTETSQYVELFLSCGSDEEAQKIADSLLDQHLIACAELMPIISKFHWHGSIEKSSEIKMVMHSKKQLFNKVEREVKKLHTYDTFVLLAIPLTDVSTDAKLWLDQVVE